jgi:hypothetical protein
MSNDENRVSQVHISRCHNFLFDAARPAVDVGSEVILAQNGGELLAVLQVLRTAAVLQNERDLMGREPKWKPPGEVLDRNADEPHTARWMITGRCSACVESTYDSSSFSGPNESFTRMSRAE